MHRLARLAGAALLALVPGVALAQAPAPEPATPPADSVAAVPAAAVLPASPEAPAVPAVPAVPVVSADTGEATYYHDALHQRRTASGERMDQEALVAAHRQYPFGTWLRVTNLRNGRSVHVRVIDRGPFGSARNMQRTIVDLSRRAARDLGFLRQGRARVQVEVLAHAPVDVDPR